MYSDITIVYQHLHLRSRDRGRDYERGGRDNPVVIQDYNHGQGGRSGYGDRSSGRDKGRFSSRPHLDGKSRSSKKMDLPHPMSWGLFTKAVMTCSSIFARQHLKVHFIKCF